MHFFKVVLFVPIAVVAIQLSGAVAMADVVDPPDVSTRAPTCKQVCHTRQVCSIEQTGTKEVCMPSEPKPTCVDAPVTGRVCHDEQECENVCN